MRHKDSILALQISRMYLVLSSVFVGSTNRVLSNNYSSAMSMSSSSEQAADATKGRNGDKNTRMIIVMITAFLLLRVPICIMGVLYIVPVHSYRTLIFFIKTNAAIRLPIYLASGKQFRRNFWRAFPCSSRRGIKRMRIGRTGQQQP